MICISRLESVKLLLKTLRTPRAVVGTKHEQSIVALNFIYYKQWAKIKVWRLKHTTQSYWCHWKHKVCLTGENCPHFYFHLIFLCLHLMVSFSVQRKRSAAEDVWCCSSSARLLSKPVCSSQKLLLLICVFVTVSIRVQRDLLMTATYLDLSALKTSTVVSTLYVDNHKY